jgi:hypothetical protein
LENKCQGRPKGKEYPLGREERKRNKEEYMSVEKLEKIQTNGSSFLVLGSTGSEK